MSTKPARVSVENVHTGRTSQVDAAKYEAMRRAMLKCLPVSAEGLTVAELKALVVLQLPQDLFPGGEKAGWWLKCVQLDLEAKELIQRIPGSKPLRLRRVARAR